LKWTPIAGGLFDAACTLNSTGSATVSAPEVPWIAWMR
jgi:hypothetical protein